MGSQHFFHKGCLVILHLPEHLTLGSLRVCSAQVECCEQHVQSETVSNPVEPQDSQPAARQDYPHNWQFVESSP